MIFKDSTRFIPLFGFIFIFASCFCLLCAQDASDESQTSPNTPPRIFGIPSDSVFVGDEYYFKPDAEDEEQEDRFTFTIKNKPNWAFFSALTGELTGTPTVSDIGTSGGIIIGVLDSQDQEALLEKFTITVVPTPNQPPIFSHKPPSKAVVGKKYHYQIRAYQPADKAQQISFQVENLPYWLEYNQTGHYLSGTPQKADEGVAEDIKITATNQNDISQELIFAITITNPNQEQ